MLAHVVSCLVPYPLLSTPQHAPLSEPRDTTEPAALRAVNLSCARGERLLFRGINVAVGGGEALQVNGPNGCGKTTLLRVLCGLTLPLEGEVYWRDTEVGLDPSRYRSELQYLGHADGIKLELTPRENLRFASELAGDPAEVSLEGVLARLGLQGYEDVNAHALSAGQRRRVALARLLLSKSALWILDEPFTALDRVGHTVIQSILEEHLNAAGSVVFSSHQEVVLRGDRVSTLELS